MQKHQESILYSELEVQYLLFWYAAIKVTTISFGAYTK